MVIVEDEEVVVVDLVTVVDEVVDEEVSYLIYKKVSYNFSHKDWTRVNSFAVVIEPSS